MRITGKTSHSNRPRYPEYRDRFSEDPARFLYVSDLYFPRVRIHSITDPDLLEAYLDVETDRNGGPRQKIIASINQRKRELEMEGSR